MDMRFLPPDFQIRNAGDTERIFDAIRRRWVVLTPEEWVRQNIIRYLTGVMGYPAALIAVEKELLVGELRKRFDVLVFDRTHRPWMLIECKAMDISLDATVLDQLLRYHSALPATFLVIANGQQAFAWERTGDRFREIEVLPAFPS